MKDFEMENQALIVAQKSIYNKTTKSVILTEKNNKVNPATAL